ncbi:MAG: acetyl-CoA carboxylase biotin carboxyl carrier protein subunit [Candidatus Thorarchaeota archaeon]
MEYINGVLYLEGEEIDIEIKPYLKPVDRYNKSTQIKDVIVKAPIPGKILEIHIEELELVEKDQLLLILEAMKMKNRILSPIKGKITQLYVNVGDQIGQDQPLVKIESISPLMR